MWDEIKRWIMELKFILSPANSPFPFKRHIPPPVALKMEFM